MEVPAKKVFCISGKDLLEFWTESSNATSFEPCVTSWPIRLPISDFNHRMKCLEDSIIMQKLEEENHFLTACNCFHRKVTSSNKSNQMNSLNCCQSNKAADVSSAGNDCVGAEDTKSCIKYPSTSCKRVIKDDLSRSVSIQETLAVTVNEKLCIEYKKDSRKESTVSNAECGSYPGQVTTNSETKPKNDFCKECFFCDLQENPPSYDSILNIHLLEYYSSSFMEILEEATRRRVFNLPRERSDFDRERTSHQDETCQSSVEGKTAKVGLLFSGGIDSMVLAAMADRFVFCLLKYFACRRICFQIWITSRTCLKAQHYDQKFCADFNHLFYDLGNYQFRHYMSAFVSSYSRISVSHLENEF